MDLEGQLDRWDRQSEDMLLQALGGGSSEKHNGESISNYREKQAKQGFNNFIAGLCNEVIDGKITKQQAEDKLRIEADRLERREKNNGRDTRWIIADFTEGLQKINAVRKPSPSNTQNNQQGAAINHYEGATVYNGPVVQGGDYVNGDKITNITKQEAPKEPTPDVQPPAQGEAAVPILTDTECLQRLVDTGFIMQNSRIIDTVRYIVKKGYSVLDVFDEAAKITGSQLRARSILIQNMTKVETTLNKHRPKHTLKS